MQARFSLPLEGSLGRILVLVPCLLQLLVGPVRCKFSVRQRAALVGNWCQGWQAKMDSICDGLMVLGCKHNILHFILWLSWSISVYHIYVFFSTERMNLKRSTIQLKNKAVLTAPTLTKKYQIKKFKKKTNMTTEHNTFVLTPARPLRSLLC